MSTPIWINSGPCPTAEVRGTLQTGAPTLQGYWEFNGLVSSPPVLYTQYTLVFSGAVYTLTPDHIVSPYPVKQTSTWSGMTGPQTTATPDSNDAIQNPDNTAGPTDNVPFTLMAVVLEDESQPGPSAAALTNGETIDPTGGQFDPFLFTVSFSSATVMQYTIAAQSTHGAMGGTSGTYAVTAGSITVTLVNPDTEAAAIARATLSEIDTDGSDPTNNYGFDGGVAGGFYSLWETRQDIDGSTPAISFGYQTGTYQIELANLLAGINYTVTVQWEQRTAAGNGSGDSSLYGSTWADADTDVFTLVASSPTQTTAAHAVPLTQGYQKRIKSISIAGSCS